MASNWLASPLCNWLVWIEVGIALVVLDYGLTSLVNISIIFHRPLRVPLHSPNGRQITTVGLCKGTVKVSNTICSKPFLWLSCFFITCCQITSSHHINNLSFPLSSFNSLWPSDDIWWHRSESTLARVMAWCLMAPSHYLNQPWLIISEVLW